MTDFNPKRVAVIGGGIAGSTATICLARLGCETTLYEKNDSLVSGPPICHLHAGGNLYREISISQCEILLKESIDTVKLYPQALNIRPTVIATPLSDSGDPLELAIRLKFLKEKYTHLVDYDVCNSVLGDPAKYYQAFSRDQLERIKLKPQPTQPSEHDEWIIPFAKGVNLDALKYPVYSVLEHGLSVFRLAACASLEIEELENANAKLNQRVECIKKIDNTWQITSISKCGEIDKQMFDYVINAAGFRTGELDNLVSSHRERLVEFKAAYISRWTDETELWPEVIFHGQRGTPKGMAQLTPYGEGYYQLHGMTQDITLFKDGLAHSTHNNAYPQLNHELLGLVELNWPMKLIEDRTNNAILHLSQFLPNFETAVVAGPPLYGAQQIPGGDATLRASTVSFAKENYARIEIVKASSCVDAARAIAEDLNIRSVENRDMNDRPIFTANVRFSNQEVEKLAVTYAKQRGYPAQLARFYGESISKEPTPV